MHDIIQICHGQIPKRPSFQAIIVIEILIIIIITVINFVCEETQDGSTECVFA